MAYKFCEVSDVLAYLRVGANYAEHDKLLSDKIIPNASTAIENYCREGSFALGVVTEYLATAESPAPVSLYLKRTNIATSPAPIFRLTYSFPLDWDAVDALDTRYYDLDHATGKLTLLFDTQQHGRSIKATYTAGYAISTDDGLTLAVPADIREACALQSAFLLERIVNQDSGLLDKKSSGGANLRMSTAAVMGLIPQVRALLNARRRQLVGRV